MGCGDGRAEQKSMEFYLMPQQLIEEGEVTSTRCLPSISASQLTLTRWERKAKPSSFVRANSFRAGYGERSTGVRLTNEIWYAINK